MTRVSRIVITVASVVIVLLLLVFAGKKGYDYYTAKSAENQQQEQQQENLITEEEKQEIILNLTVNLDDGTINTLFPDVSWVALTDSYPVVYGDDLMIDNSQQSRRTKAAGFDDAVSMPFKVTDDAQLMLNEEYEEILRDPIDGLMVARGLVDLEIVDGQTLGSMNPWLVDLIKTADEAMAKKEHPYGNEVFLTYRQMDGQGDYVRDATTNQPVVYVTSDYRANAVRLCVLIDRFTNLGMKSGYRSISNYCLNNSAEAARTQAILADYQEKKEALILTFVRKDGRSIVTIGFNRHDKRFEILELVPVTTQPKPQPPKDDDTPQPKPGDGDDPTPDPKPGDDPTPDPKPGDDPTPDPKPGNPQKHPEDDPVNNGNADTGGGQNQDGDGSGPEQKEDPATDDSGGHKNPDDVVPDTPAQDDQHPNPADNTDENKMPYTPDNQDQDTTWTDNSNSNHQESYGGGNNNNNSGSGNTNQGGSPAGEFSKPD